MNLAIHANPELLYKYELLEERGYLCRAGSEDGAGYVNSNDRSFGNLQLGRRTVYVVKLAQRGKNCGVYGSGLIYMDAETSRFHHVDNCDPKGRLYRTTDPVRGWHPKMGMPTMSAGVYLTKDHIDTHSSAILEWEIPAIWQRKDLSLEGFIGSK